MSRKLKSIGLAVIVVCAFGAISASGAQAAHWTVEGKALGTGVSEKIATATTVTKFGSETTPSLTLTVPNFLRITCTGLDIEEGKITGPNKDSGSFLFTTCSVLTSTGGTTKCTVKSSGGTIGKIQSEATVSTLVDGTGGVVYDTIEPAVETTFVSLVIAAAEGGTCALSGTYKVAGKVALQATTGTNETYLDFTSSEAIQKADKAVLTFGAREAFLDGTVDLALESDKKWGVDAN